MPGKLSEVEYFLFQTLLIFFSNGFTVSFCTELMLDILAHNSETGNFGEVTQSRDPAYSGLSQ